tara:strand:+ start:273 stop:488 length:216 start_codon:yes stop_codon:yes gene_type:complete
MSAPKNQWYHKKIEFDSMSVEELVEFFKDKQFFMYNCNDPQWNNAMIRLRDVYGSIRPDPKTGFGVIHKID